MDTPKKRAARQSPVGLGVWQIEGESAVSLIRHAIDLGYGLIDTAAAYKNEDLVGLALRDAGRAAESVQVTTKVWMAEYDRVAGAIDRSRRLLGRDRIDTVLLHWPVPARFDRTIRAYESLLDLVARDVIGAVGVSNFSVEHLMRLRSAVGHVPALNQLEIHPLFSQVDARRHHDAAGIETQAYSPLGGPVGRRARPVDHPIVVAIAAEVSATPAQVVLAWHRHHGVGTIPRTSSLARLAENLASRTIALDPAQVARIDALDAGLRISPDPETTDEFTLS